MNLVDCTECRFFIRDDVGDGSGIGRCKKLEEYKSKGVNQKAIDRAFKALGNKLFWGSPGRNRRCGKYEELL